MSPPSPAPKTEFQKVVLPAGTTITRVHWTANGPVWFGPEAGKKPTNRFDAPNGEFQTLYAAEDLHGAFAETVLRKAARIIAWPFVRDRSWSELELLRDVTLAKLHGTGLSAAGETADIVAGDNYTRSRAKALEAFQAGHDGIIYRARHNNDRICYALFSRVKSEDLDPRPQKYFSDYFPVADGMLKEVDAVWDPLHPIPSLAALS